MGDMWIMLEHEYCTIYLRCYDDDSLFNNNNELHKFPISFF